MPKKKTKKVNKKRKKATKKATSQNFPKFSPEQRMEIIAEWKAFPSLIRKMGLDAIQNLGLDPSEWEVFLLLKTREELADHLGISRRQLYTDEHTDEVEERVRELEKKWAGDRTPNVILGLYRGAVKEGDAARVKLWFQIFRDWSEKQKMEHAGTITWREILGEIEDEEEKNQKSHSD